MRLKRAASVGVGLQAKRLWTGWHTDYLLKVLKQLERDCPVQFRLSLPTETNRRLLISYILQPLQRRFQYSLCYNALDAGSPTTAPLTVTPHH